MLGRMSPPRAVLVAVLVAVLAACGVRARPVDTTRLVAELGLDGAVEALRIRIADDPKDIPARRALADLEHRRGRPGAVIAELAAVRELGGPLGVRLDRGERTRLAGLYRERARLRVARGSPDALDDLDLARRIAGAAGEDAALRRDAEITAALADLRHTDPDRRARGAEALGRDTSTIDGLGATGLYLFEHGALRAAHDLLEAWERGGGRDRGAPDTAAITDAWLAARAWWRGPSGRPDLATLDRAIAAGASPCHFATRPGEHGCTAAAVLGDPARERALLARARARGWRTADPDDAAAWAAITAAAWQRGEIRSWLDELDARVDLSALDPADLARPDGAMHRQATDVPSPAEVVAAAVAPEAPGGLVEVARAYLRDPAAGDRVAEDVVARSVDVAAAAPPVAELFAVLGDPARARAWWERAVAASPDDVTLRAGLVRALAAAADGEAARLHLTHVAAGSGDPARALLAGARALADAGLTVDALAPAKQALELTPQGDEQEVLLLLVELAERLDRRDQVRELGRALDRVRTAPDATTLRARAAAGDAEAIARAHAADPADAGLAIAAARAEPDDERALAILAVASAANPDDVPLRVARLDRGDDRALAELAAIAMAPAVRFEVRAEAARAYVRLVEEQGGSRRRTPAPRTR